MNKELYKSLILGISFIIGIFIYTEQTKYELHHSPVFECLKKDVWYRIYRDFVKRENMSKNNLIGVLARILIDHGMTVKYDDFFYRDENVDADDLQKSIKQIESKVQQQKATDISKADDINEETFQKLDKKETTTKQEKQQVAKHFFQKFMVCLNFLVKHLMNFLL